MPANSQVQTVLLAPAGFTMLSTPCPTCHAPAEVGCIPSPLGLMPLALSTPQLHAHAHCDLVALGRAFARALTTTQGGDHA